MAIPESQLETWAHQGSVAQSSDTYKSVKAALEAGQYSGKSAETFLQGSYGNDTNIWAESDVDVVTCLEHVFQSDLSGMTEREQQLQKAAFEDATYTHTDFKRDVLKALTAKYGAAVTDGGKAIAIKADGNRRKSDVIAAIQFRRYYKFNSLSDQSYTQGICFWNKAGERIANYPKQHSANLTNKHKATANWFKPMVRVLKNMRTKCVDEGLLAAGTAPSYYIEGLLYNVPDSKFGGSYGATFFNALTWIQTEADKDKMVCANEQYYLLRDGHHTCWPKANGDALLKAVVTLWDSW
jgi:hypothetical protein